MFRHNQKTALTGIDMNQGDDVMWGDLKTIVLLQYDHEHAYVETGETAQLVHISELTPITE
jgi:hypothetical protein